MDCRQIVVIGGGIVGLCSAYYLAKSGHQVAVLERRGNVAEEASFGQPGLLAPGSILSQAMPVLPKGLLSSLFGRDGRVIFKPQADRNLRLWMRQWMVETTSERFRINAIQLQNLARYSQQAIRDLEELHQPEFEQSEGSMVLFRSEEDMAAAETAIEIATSAGVSLKRIDADAARALEPGLSKESPLAGALYAPDDLSGNCALFARQLKQIVQSLGVQFHFNSHVDAIEPGVHGHGIGVRVGNETFHVDAVVVAAGCSSPGLLMPLGVALPLQAIKGYTATATIREYDGAPQGSIVDAGYQISLSRMGNRIRISGVVEPGVRDREIGERAMRLLIQVASDWFPGATNYNNATFWAGLRPMMSDGRPVIGATRIPNLYVSTGHGAAAWSLAAGSGKILADRISGRAPEIEDDAFSPMRHG